MKPLFLVLGLLPFVSLAATSSGNVSSCEAIKKDKCINFRGRAISAMGRAGTRIWRIGTKHIFEVQNQTESAYAELEKVNFHNKIYANFEGCPVEKFKQGSMQGICIESMKNIRVEAIPE
ncbi:MAG: hypothetical protein ACXWQO_18495 [Bdellovibrionota bacterium]